MSDKSVYPQLKTHELTHQVKQDIRTALKLGADNIYTIASTFSCSTSQVAALKAWRKRLQNKES